MSNWHGVLIAVLIIVGSLVVFGGLALLERRDRR